MNKSRRDILRMGLGVSLGTMNWPALGANVGRHKRLSKDPIILGHGDYQYKIVDNWGQMSAIRNPILNCHEMQDESHKNQVRNAHLPF